MFEPKKEAIMITDTTTTGLLCLLACTLTSVPSDSPRVSDGEEENLGFREENLGFCTSSGKLRRAAAHETDYLAASNS